MTAKEWTNSPQGGGGFIETYQAMTEYAAYYHTEMSKWVRVEDREPSCYISGNFDGLKSEPILCINKAEVEHVAVVYKGILDGNKFCDFYTLDDYEIENVTHWQPLPEPPKPNEI